MRCLQPGCTGSIVDGYCDVCGMPSPGGIHSAAAASVAPLGHAIPMPATASPMPARVAPMPTGGGIPQPPPAKVPTGRCRMPGCNGNIIDGYCDVCGSPAGATEASSAPRSPSTGQTSVTRASSLLSSTALGSARAGGAASRSTKRIRETAKRLRAARLGAGLTSVPPAPYVDPETAVMKDTAIPEDKRVCPHCGSPVGRSHDSDEGRLEGFCPKCRRPYSFTPKLKNGDLVAGQYEVHGALAHGGMGWIYLARDKNVSDRWVVLKGLLNVGDADALNSAIAEQQFLAQVENPLIVEIYNFVTHEGAGYIVMEYVGGRSLKELLKQRMSANGGAYDALPVDWALAYIHETLPAFSYLHEQHLLYCDFKPDNVLQIDDSIKLIDLGGVRRMDDDDSSIFGTSGYQAPEVATVGPSVASDIYTIGRTLLVLCAEFRGYQSTYEFTLPPVDEMPLFAEYDSLFRLLLKCCAADPADRFVSADELRVQLLGVLREVVGSMHSGIAQTSATSLLFDPPAVTGDTFDWTQLPKLKPDTTDPQYAWLSAINYTDPVERLSALDSAPQATAEVLLAKAMAALEMDNQRLVRQYVNELLAADPWEWRAVWVSGVVAMKLGDWRTAQSSFNAVYGQVPGELAPKIALAVACEQGGEPAIAENLYLICASTDANYVTPAAFGLARLRAQRRDLQGTLDALDMVPSTSRGYLESRRLEAEHLLGFGAGLPDLQRAMTATHNARLDALTQARIDVDIYERALEVVTTKGAQATTTIGAVPATPVALRDRLETAYRRLAVLEPESPVRVQLVEKANRTRKWSLL
ncbi:MAG TPA: tetratricopeptide repeat protein [Cellulomonadaceae bacterium]|nr:tetratricopeptide repeat protein [Cellulomonadaceae bacterium]